MGRGGAGFPEQASYDAAAKSPAPQPVRRDRGKKAGGTAGGHASASLGYIGHNTKIKRIMRIQVKLFAILRDQAGQSETSLELPEGATVQQARKRLIQTLPAIASYMDRVAFAINFSYARPESVLHDGDELAVLPPVSGG